MSSAAIKILKDEIAELRARIVDLEKRGSAEPVKKGKKAKDPDAPKREPSAWAKSLSVVSALVKEALEGKKMPAGLHLKVAGYLKSKEIAEPDVDDVVEAIEFLEKNPDYKSGSQKARSVDESEIKKPKARGRPKKQPTPTAEDEAEESEEDEEAEEAEEEPKKEFNTPKSFTMPNFSNLTFKGVDYLLDDEENEVFTADGEMKWMGTWNGKKIVLGEKSERVKKIIAAAE
jgi:hypothetical protein